ncbi:MAG: hypothetical protein AMXMBFR7_47880 [Planctomycetota bacterium]
MVVYATLSTVSFSLVKRLPESYVRSTSVLYRPQFAAVNRLAKSYVARRPIRAHEVPPAVSVHRTHYGGDPNLIKLDIRAMRTVRLIA